MSLDRQERGTGELSAIQEIERDLGVRVVSIIRLDDLVAHLEEMGTDSASLEAVREYRRKYAAVTPA